MCQTCEGKSVSPNKFFNQIKKTLHKREKKILGAVQDLTAKQHSQSSPIWVEIPRLDCKCYLASFFQTAPMNFFIFSAHIFFKIYLTKHFCPHIFDTYYFSYRCSAHNLQFTVFYIVFRTNYNTQGLLQDAFRNTCYVYI